MAHRLPKRACLSTHSDTLGVAMNYLNRIIILLLDLLICAGAIVITLITFGMLSPAQILPSLLRETALSTWLAGLNGLEMPQQALIALGMLAILGIGLLIGWYELRPRAQAQPLIIRDDAVGQVSVQIESIRRLIAYTAAQHPQVLQLEPQIQLLPEGLHIQCAITLAPNALLPVVTSELQRDLKQAVEHHIGMRVIKIHIHVQSEPIAHTPPLRLPRASHRMVR
ncbi:alkaline shock response membrane anchor protein AmaP [Chloroflexia bacterium SDU3-3]|nr:alkaline shock response membrane anchor protein AmaP [Chloroflexia bacterium SDU3-3]